jgi:hypothetical protein
VIFAPDQVECGFNHTVTIDLCTSRVEAPGWKPHVGFDRMLEKLAGMTFAQKESVCCRY